MCKLRFLLLFTLILIYGCENRALDSFADVYNDVLEIGVDEFVSGEELSPALKLVDPFIGTGGYGPWGVGNNLPGASAPFGMAKPSPDTQSEKKYTFQTHCAGYHYNDEYIAGFSNVHFAGTGVPDYGNLRVLPLYFFDGINGKTETYRSKYKKNSEHSEPAYYSVELESGIVAELTATERVAFHKYIFGKEDKMKCLLFDIGKSLPLSIVTESELSINQKTGEIKGYAHQNGGLSINFGGYDIYFYGKVDKSPDKLYGWEGDETIKENRARCKDGGMCGLIACYKDVDELVVKISVSYTSFDGAKNNFLAEAENLDFDSARKKTLKMWDKILGRVRIEGGNIDELKSFYTALYHIFMMPTLQSDVDNNYRGFDRQNHKALWGRYYSDFSMWDTYRTLHPFLSLAFKSYQRDMQHSLLQMAKEGGYFPKWALANGETNCMIGSPADILIVDGFLKGVEMPYEEAYQYILKTALDSPPRGSGYNGRDGLSDYMRFGYVTASEGGSVSKTMELSFADNALCNMATEMKKPESSIFCKNRYNYRNHYSEKSGYFLPKNSNGEFLNEEGFDPDGMSYDVLNPDNADYIEGTSHHYRWFAFYDIDWLIQKDEGKDRFAERLRELFEKSISEEIEAQQDPQRIGQSRKYLWMGNEPDIHYVYLFSLADRMDLICKYINWIRKTYFRPTPEGLPGNDDGGTLSAWYVFSALGFYPIAGTNEYILGCPQFDKIELELENGKIIRVIREGEITEESFVDKVFVNGKEVSNGKIYYNQIKDGAEIRFFMKSK